MTSTRFGSYDLVTEVRTGQALSEVVDKSSAQPNAKERRLLSWLDISGGSAIHVKTLHLW